jgi:hypothetical protein
MGYDPDAEGGHFSAGDKNAQCLHLDTRTSIFCLILWIQYPYPLLETQVEAPVYGKKTYGEPNRKNKRAERGG